MTAQVNGVPSGRRTRRTLATMAAAVVALASLATGCFFFDAEPEELGVVWDTPEDRKTESQGNGAWLSGDTLVRSRFDAVSGYDARTGKRSWEYVPPGRSAVCHVAADTDSSVLVLTRDGDGTSAPAKGKLCADVVAIDMNNGGEIWHTPLPALDPWATRLQSYTVSAGSGIAVLLRGDDLQAVDVRTGKTRWKAALPKGCVPGTTAVAERQVAALLACGGTEYLLGDKVPSDAELFVATFAPATGALLWSAPLKARTSVPWDARAEFVSADPVVVAASDSGDSDSGGYLSFDRNGRPNPGIDFKGPYGEMQFHRRLTAAVDDTRLYLLPRKQGRLTRDDAYPLTTFDLATGVVVWGGTAEDDRLDGATGYRVLAQNGKLTVLTSGPGDSSYGFRVLDAATGEQREARSLPEGQDPADTLFTYKDRLIGARYEHHTTSSKPFTAYERR
ncbi:PQQ-binding-like beta-propeller repeat protein [Streptomyces sp. NBC_01353]|uniref:outer membrane protein assembly factor BamB family protein n=1 Tax=Streptomyces sp. NBC_01353 TaxID=2903835 RepID=UPI002E36240C|nr:PQQ-binding-like beta-propeller repeat protein [Streptomyces sp. NBC_01353]